MPNWIYDLSSVTTVALFAAVFVSVCWLGTVAARPLVKRTLHREPGLNETSGDFLQYFGVIYGLLLGLLAVATYQNLADVEKAVASEASSLAALYRDVSEYPEPARSELQALVEEAWPLQQQGIVPSGAVTKVAAIEDRIVQFEPATKSQEALHEAALRQFNSFFEHRRTRLYSVTAAIPGVLWYTVVIGALINMMMIWLFDLRLGVHLLLGGTISFFLATMISLIVLMDQPFRGEVSISPQAFQLIYDQLMQPK